MDSTSAKKYLGQHFLRDKNILRKIVGSLTLQDRDILEIGPGPGDLTEVILETHPRSLTLVEIDEDMIQRLHERFAGETLGIYHGDVLRFGIEPGASPHYTGIEAIEHEYMTMPSDYTVYGNIPYYITSPILAHFLHEIAHPPQTMILTMQREVADRILATDGKHSVLSLMCQMMADVTKVCDISPGSFTPPPKVWSTCLHFERRVSPMLSTTSLRLIKDGFAQKRKKLISNLASYEKRDGDLKKIFQELHLSENIRAEELTIDQWSALSQHLIPNSIPNIQYDDL